MICKGSRKVTAKSRCSDWPAVTPRCPGVGGPCSMLLAVAGGLSLRINPDFSFAERGFSVFLGERNVGVCRRLYYHLVHFLVCVLKAEGG